MIQHGARRRIDYVLASLGVAPFARAANIHTRVMGSDHCPVEVLLASSVMGLP